MSTSDNAPFADVYADDTSSPAPISSDSDVHVLTIEADAEAGTFARIANVLNIANIAPRRASLRLVENGLKLRIHVELAVGNDTAQSIQRKLAQLTDVIRVELARIGPRT